MADFSDVLGSAEVCDLLGVDRSTLIRWVQFGKIPAHKLRGVNGAYLFRRGDVEALAKKLKAA